jgi:retinol dehydrogenase-12
VNPGLCHSGLARDAGSFRLTIMKALLARSTEAGSRTLVHAAVAGLESHGKYMSNCMVTDPSPFVRSEEGSVTQKRVWKELSAKLENIKPGILSNL